ncbi:MAG: hypothetical protein V1696_00570 [Candidatus Jorgensenbacteria bacterium]
MSPQKSLRIARITRILERVRDFGPAFLILPLFLLFALDLAFLAWNAGIETVIRPSGAATLDLGASIIRAVAFLAAEVFIILSSLYLAVQCSTKLLPDPIINVIQFLILCRSYPLSAKDRMGVARAAVSALAARFVSMSDEKAGISKRDDPELSAACELLWRAVKYAKENGCPIQGESARDFVIS